MIEIINRFKFTVPSNGVAIWSEADFDDPQDGIDAMKRAFADGQISDWEFWEITKTTTEELVMEQHIDA